MIHKISYIPVETFNSDIEHIIYLIYVKLFNSIYILNVNFDIYYFRYLICISDMYDIYWISAYSYNIS